MSKSIDYKKEYFKEKKKNKFAWGQYFQLRNELFALETHIFDELDKEPALPQEITEHLSKFIQDLYKNAKTAIECPICMEKIESDQLYTTGCGHNFHISCINQLKKSTKTDLLKCPICRKNIYNK